MGERPEQREMRDRGHRSSGLADFLFQEFRSAVADIRTKLLDEGWFGRRTGSAGHFENSPLGWKIDRDPDDATRSLSSDAFASKEGHEVYGAPHRREPSFEEQWAPRAPSENEPGSPSDHGLER